MGAIEDFRTAGSVTNGNARALGKKGKPEASADTVPERDYKDDVIEDLNNDLRKLQKSLTCVICLDMLFEPYSLQCGHVFCYTCMLGWLGGQRERTCPECRDVVKIQPAPAYLIREMTEVFVYRAELTSPQGIGAELRKQQREALKAVEKDKGKNGLFDGMFKKRKKPLRAMRDPEDGVLRCPECNWEVGGGFCDHCGLSIRTGSHRSGDFSDNEGDDDTGSETESDREDNRHIPVWDDEEEFDEELDGEEDEEDWEDDGHMHMQRQRYGFGLRRHDDDDDDDDEDDDDDDDDGIRDLRDSSVSTVGGRNEPINIDDDSDLSLQVTYTSRRAIPPMRTGRRPPPGIISQAREQPRASRRTILESSEIEEESEDDDEDEGSLADFVEHDTPENRRRPAPRRNRPGGLRDFLNNGPMIISSSPVIAAPARRNTRRTVLEDEEENQSSVSEASSRPPPFRGEIRHNYTQRRGPIALPSDNDDDEVELLSGYTPLDYTASENEDDESASPSVIRGQHINPANRPSGPGSVFSVPEEDEEDEESRAFGDDDESEDQDGDVRMGGSEQRNERRGAGSSGNTRPGTNGQRATRNRTRMSRPQVVEDEDSDSDSDVPPVTRRRRIQNTGIRSGARGSNHFRALYRDSSGSSRQANSGRRQREIDPAFLNMFQQHSQAITERQLENLGFMNSSVSPARSATPVQRHYTGGSTRGSRSTRESTRELTPVQAMGQSSPPPPFSPMFQGISSSPASMASNNPPSSPQVQSPRLGASARAGVDSTPNNQTWNNALQTLRPVPITIGSSPQASRIRSRNSRQQLRGSSSRSGLRVGSVTPTPTNLQLAQPSQGGTSIASVAGRQQGARPVLTAAASRGRRGVALTTEDIRARGEAEVRRRQQEAAEAASNVGLGRRSSRRDLSANTNSASTAPAPLATLGRTATGNFQGTGRRLGAVIGGAPGGPMLIIGSEDDCGERR